ncbi:hypothetical protein KM043_017233 [Ampulex compressa]|nr:hypothetical protein KM043_017233 [Ampulex compressa]
MIYHKPTTPRFRIAERISVPGNNRPVYNKQGSHSSTCSLRSAGSTPPCVNRIKQPLGSKGPSPVHTGTPARSGIQSPKPTINGSDPIARQNSVSGTVYDASVQESHYDVIKPLKDASSRATPIALTLRGPLSQIQLDWLNYRFVKRIKERPADRFNWQFGQSNPTVTRRALPLLKILPDKQQCLDGVTFASQCPLCLWWRKRKLEKEQEHYCDD